MTGTGDPRTASVNNWDRAAIVALGAAGCALSYSALQQMAVAIHVRGQLTYLFPLVIDGFIAYGVRALLVLADAPLRARLYVWTLFGTATTASIWANALHAVRLNQQTVATGLRLGNSVVAVLSTLAPLALAGAVHLYILITRHHRAGQPHDALPAGPAPQTSGRFGPETARPEPADRTLARRDGRGPLSRERTADQHQVPGQADHAGTAIAAGPPDRQIPDQNQGGTDHQQTVPGPDRADYARADHGDGPQVQRTTTPDRPDQAPAADPDRTGAHLARATVSAGPGESTKTVAWPQVAPGDPPADHLGRGLRRTDASTGGADQPDQQPEANGPSQVADRTGPIQRTTTSPVIRPVTSADHADDGPRTGRRTTSEAGQQTSGGVDRETDSGSTTSGPLSMDELLPLAREAALEEGRLTRRALRPHLRDKGISISNENFHLLQNLLHEDPLLAHLPRSPRRAR